MLLGKVSYLKKALEKLCGSTHNFGALRKADRPEITPLVSIFEVFHLVSHSHHFFLQVFNLALRVADSVVNMLQAPLHFNLFLLKSNHLALEHGQRIG